MSNKVNHRLLSNVVVSLALLCVGVCGGGCGNNSGGGGGGKLNSLADVTADSTPKQVAGIICKKINECVSTNSGLKKLAERCEEGQETLVKQQLEKYKDVACGKIVANARAACEVAGDCATMGTGRVSCMEKKLEACHLSESPGSANYSAFAAPVREYYAAVKSTCTGASAKYFRDVSESTTILNIVNMDASSRRSQETEPPCTVTGLSELIACIKKYNCEPEKLKDECGLTLTSRDDSGGVVGVEPSSNPNEVSNRCYGYL